MAAVPKQDSNSVGLSYCQEDSIGVVSGDETWYKLEPNSFSDFGGELGKLARSFINDTRSRQKGATVDLDATAGFNVDLTQTNLQDLLQGFTFATAVSKGQQTVSGASAVNTTADTYNIAATAGFVVNGLFFGTGFTNAANNGLHKITTVTLNTSIATNDNLVTETPPAGAKVTVVGFVAASNGDIDIDASGSLPRITSTTTLLNSFGLSAGDWLWIGGDSAQMRFTTQANRGWARIKSVDSATSITLDKTQNTLVTEANTTTTPQFFFARVVNKNANAAANIVRRTYQLERTLGAPDNALPAQIQSEYVVGSVANQLTFHTEAASKVNVDLGFVGTNFEQRSGATGVKAGTRAAYVAEDMWNTTSDFSKLKLSVLNPTNANPTALFAYLLNMNLTINNNAAPLKAVGTLGAFDITVGDFAVSGDMEVYFADVASIDAVKNNSDVTLDYAMVKGTAGAKSGVLVDVPLFGLGGGRLNVEKDQPIKMPLTYDAGADRTFGHTIWIGHFDYLPDLADASV